MQGKFEYLPTITMNDCLFVDDIGNCCIKAIDQAGGAYYYINVTDEVGITRNLTISCIFEDNPSLLTKSTGIHFSRSHFSKTVIEKEIKMFLRYKEIAECVDIAEARDAVPDIGRLYFEESGC